MVVLMSCTNFMLSRLQDSGKGVTVPNGSPKAVKAGWASMRIGLASACTEWAWLGLNAGLSGFGHGGV